jgi:hypothetical protein
MPLNKQTIFIIGGVVAVLLIIVFINNQTKTLKAELKTLAEEHDEFKKLTVGHIRNLYGNYNTYEPQPNRGEERGEKKRKIIGDVKITRPEEKNYKIEDDEENKSIQQEIDKINELENVGDVGNVEKKEEKKDEKKENHSLYADITSNGSGQILEKLSSEELERLERMRQEDASKFKSK